MSALAPLLDCFVQHCGNLERGLYVSESNGWMLKFEQEVDLSVRVQLFSFILRHAQSFNGSPYVVFLSLVHLHRLMRGLKDPNGAALEVVVEIQQLLIHFESCGACDSLCAKQLHRCFALLLLLRMSLSAHAGGAEGLIATTLSLPDSRLTEITEFVPEELCFLLKYQRTDSSIHHFRGALAPFKQSLFARYFAQCERLAMCSAEALEAELGAFLRLSKMLKSWVLLEELEGQWLIDPNEWFGLWGATDQTCVALLQGLQTMLLGGFLRGQHRDVDGLRDAIIVLEEVLSGVLFNFDALHSEYADMADRINVFFLDHFLFVIQALFGLGDCAAILDCMADLGHHAPFRESCELVSEQFLIVFANSLITFTDYLLVKSTSLSSPQLQSRLQLFVSAIILFSSVHFPHVSLLLVDTLTVVPRIVRESVGDGLDAFFVKCAPVLLQVYGSHVSFPPESDAKLLQFIHTLDRGYGAFSCGEELEMVRLNLEYRNECSLLFQAIFTQWSRALDGLMQYFQSVARQLHELLVLATGSAGAPGTASQQSLVMLNRRIEASVFVLCCLLDSAYEFRDSSFAFNELTVPGLDSISNGWGIILVYLTDSSSKLLGCAEPCTLLLLMKQLFDLWSRSLDSVPRIFANLDHPLQLAVDGRIVSMQSVIKAQVDVLCGCISVDSLRKPVIGCLAKLVGGLSGRMAEFARELCQWTLDAVRSRWTAFDKDDFKNLFFVIGKLASVPGCDPDLACCDAVLGYLVSSIMEASSSLAALSSGSNSNSNANANANATANIASAECYLVGLKGFFRGIGDTDSGLFECAATSGGSSTGAGARTESLLHSLVQLLGYFISMREASAGGHALNALMSLVCEVVGSVLQASPLSGPASSQFLASWMQLAVRCSYPTPGLVLVVRIMLRLGDDAHAQEHLPTTAHFADATLGHLGSLFSGVCVGPAGAEQECFVECALELAQETLLLFRQWMVSFPSLMHAPRAGSEAGAAQGCDGCLSCVYLRLFLVLLELPRHCFPFDVALMRHLNSTFQSVLEISQWSRPAFAFFRDRLGQFLVLVLQQLFFGSNEKYNRMFSIFLEKGVLFLVHFSKSEAEGRELLASVDEALCSVLRVDLFPELQARFPPDRFPLGGGLASVQDVCRHLHSTLLDSILSTRVRLAALELAKLFRR